MTLNKKKIGKFLFVAAGIYVGFFIILVLAQRSFMYYPLGNFAPDISKAPYMQWIDVTTSDGLDLKAWYKPPGEAQPTVVYFHGNARNIGNRMPRIRTMVREDYGVLLAEYRGYGGNPGSPSEEGLYKDARAYINWVQAKKGLQPSDMIIYGESLGTGVAVQMATEFESKALILETPYDSVLNVAQSKFPMYPFLGHFLKDQYLSDQKIMNINTPVFMGIAGWDVVIPPRFAHRLYDLAVQPKSVKVYDGASHLGLHYSGFEDDIITFIEKL